MIFEGSEKITYSEAIEKINIIQEQFNKMNLSKDKQISDEESKKCSLLFKKLNEVAGKMRLQKFKLNEETRMFIENLARNLMDFMEYKEWQRYSADGFRDAASLLLDVL